MTRVSFETSFDSKQPKLVLALSKTKRLFRLFRFYTETESFDVLIEPKQTEDPPKQFKREYIWVFFRNFRVVSVCFGCFDIGSKPWNKPKYFVFWFMKQTETNAKQILFRFGFEPKFIFVCFEDTLLRTLPTDTREGRGGAGERGRWVGFMFYHLSVQGG